MIKLVLRNAQGSVTEAVPRGSIKRPITCPESTFDHLTVLSMPQVSFKFIQIASLSRRRHGFDSRTGRQDFNYFSNHLGPDGPVECVINSFLKHHFLTFTECGGKRFFTQ